MKTANEFGATVADPLERVDLPDARYTTSTGHDLRRCWPQAPQMMRRAPGFSKGSKSSRCRSCAMRRRRPPALTARRDLRRVPLSIDSSAHAEKVGPGVRIGRSLVAQSSLICNATNGSRPAPEATDRLAIAFAAKQSRPSRRADAACSAGSDCPPPRHPSQVWAIATSPSDSCVWRLRDHEGDRATDSRAVACRRTGGRERLRAGPLRYECGPGGVHPGDSAEEGTKRRGCQRRSDRRCRRCRAT